MRSYQASDYEAVAALWSAANRELAPPAMKEQFEHYIATALLDELGKLEEIFAPSLRNSFWVVEAEESVIGTFGIQACSEDTTELRRMYLDARHRGSGLATDMLAHAERHAVLNGFTSMVLSTAEIQEAALAFYRKHDYRLVRTEVADTVTTKTVGGGLTRYHFEKTLV